MSAITTVFEKIPDYFVEKYDKQICEWAANFSAIGPERNIVLREGHLSDVSPNPEVGAVLIRVTLKAEWQPRARRMTISPASERDREMIVKHCEKMERLKVSPRLILKEPERPFIPFIPNELWKPPAADNDNGA